MIRYNGKGYSSWKEAPVEHSSFSQLGAQFSIPIYWKGNQPLLWEETYFYWMSSLRRWRVQIPMSLSPDYLEAQVRALGISIAADEIHLFVLTAFRELAPKADNPLTPLGWVLESRGVYAPSSIVDNYEIGLFKDLYLSGDYFATLPASHQTQRDLAQIYAYENGYADCLLLNTQKNLVESAQGSLFLWINEAVVSPNLASGCRDSVLRAAFINALKKNANISVAVRPVSPFELQNAEALLILPPYTGAASVTRYRKKTYTSSALKDVLTDFWTKLL